MSATEFVDRLAIVKAMIACYNAKNAKAYASFMTEDALEGNYCGEVLRDGRSGIRSGLEVIFSEYPENCAEILDSKLVGEFVVMHERVSRGQKKGGFEIAAPFNVTAIYSFQGDKVSRVEFIR